MRKFITLLVSLIPSLSIAQVDNAEAIFRSLTDNAPLLDMERVELDLNPAIETDEIAGVSVDQDGNIYLFQRNPEIDSIIVVSQDGNVVRSFGKGDFARPHSIRVAPDGNVWGIDSQISLLVKYSPSGEKLLEIDVGGVPYPDRVSCGTSDITFDDNGHMYISDGYCNARVIEYDAEGQMIKEWGEAGSGPGQLNLPHGLVLGPDNNLYVADRSNGRVQIFSTDGEYQKEWFYGGVVLDIAFTENGDLYLSAEPRDAEPMQEAMLLKLDPSNGNIIGKINDFGHEISVGPGGILVPATLSLPVRFYRP